MLTIIFSKFYNIDPYVITFIKNLLLFQPIHVEATLRDKHYRNGEVKISMPRSLFSKNLSSLRGSREWVWGSADRDNLF